MDGQSLPGAAKGSSPGPPARHGRSWPQHYNYWTVLRGLAMSVVLALAGAGICPTQSRAQLATPAAPPIRMPSGEDLNELQPFGAGDPAELKAATDDGPTAIPSWETNGIHSGQEEAGTGVRRGDKSEVQGPGFCRASPP